MDYFTFHVVQEMNAYGLTIGLAIALGVMLVDKKISLLNKKNSVVIFEKYFYTYVFSALFFGVIGARLWHVATDFYLYKNNIIKVFYTWEGGLSIFGAMVGGAFGLWVVSKILKELNPKKEDSLQAMFVADLAIFGLPFAQALGRFANYFNQELYGLPTDLPWAIYIDSANRLAEYAQYSKYHPLFLYESIAMFLFGCLVWKIDDKKEYSWKIGEGNFVFLYVWFYSGLRFFLDFLRIQKQSITLFSEYDIGVNQLITGLLFVALSIYWIFISRKNTIRSS